MKLRLLYLLPIILAFASSCHKTASPVLPNNPDGQFTGTFKFTHVHEKTGVVDSSTVNLQLSLENGKYAVTGDTTTLHAGSYGDYATITNSNIIQFIDKTFPPAGTPVKVHLSGTYEYIYNGVNLQMASYSALDTLSYYYNLRRTGN